MKPGSVKSRLAAKFAKHWMSDEELADRVEREEKARFRAVERTFSSKDPMASIQRQVKGYGREHERRVRSQISRRTEAEIDELFALATRDRRTSFTFWLADAMFKVFNLVDMDYLEEAIRIRRTASKRSRS